MKLLLSLLLLLSIAALAESKYYAKATHLGPGVIAISCLNGGDPTVAGNINGVLLVSCGDRK